jgi:hypothetical protein
VFPTSTVAGLLKWIVGMMREGPDDARSGGRWQIWRRINLQFAVRLLMLIRSHSLRNAGAKSSIRPGGERLISMKGE